MRMFLGFVKKEFFHIYRDKRTLLFLFGIPIAQIFIFGYVINMEVNNYEIAILDKSKDNVTIEITNKILSSKYYIRRENITSDVEIEELFKKGKVKQVIVFEKDFARNLKSHKAANVQIIADASETNIANLLINYTTAIINSYLKEKSIGSDAPPKIIPKVRMLYNPSLKSAYMFVPGTIAMIIILLSAMMTSITIAREKELGTMEVLMVSPLQPSQIILGKIIPYFCISLINTLIIILLGNIVFNIPQHGNFALLLLENILYIFLSLSIGLFISTLVDSQQVAMFSSLFALFFPTFFLSGYIFPIENMPKILQWFSCIVPSKWFIIIIKNIMLKGTGFIYVWKETLILCMMTIGFIFLTIKKYKLRLE